MTKSLVKTISNEINLFVINLISEDRLNYILFYIKDNPKILLEANELVSNKINYMLKEFTYGNNYGTSSEYNVYQANISTYENLLTVFLEIPQLKKQAIELLSDQNVLKNILNTTLKQVKKEVDNQYTIISYSKFKKLGKLEDTKNLGEIEEIVNYAPQHAIKFILNNYKSFDSNILQQVLSVNLETEKELLNYLQLDDIEEIKKLPKPILTIMKEKNLFTEQKKLKLK